MWIADWNPSLSDVRRILVSIEASVMWICYKMFPNAFVPQVDHVLFLWPERDSHSWQLFQDLLVSNVNMPSMNVNPIPVPHKANVLIYRMDIPVSVVRREVFDEKVCTTLSSSLDSGWTGVDCSIDIDECKTIQPCRAAKTCINLPGSYKCECLDSFTGHNCEMVCMYEWWLLSLCLSDICPVSWWQVHLSIDN